jgi:superfamily II DNA helicase RecQ
MKDQVDALVDRGVKAANLDSTLGAERSAWVKEEVISGRLKLLYVAPERFSFRHDSCVTLTISSRLNNEGFIAMMSHVKISLLAIDESHCISQVCFVWITCTTLSLMSGS